MATQVQVTTLPTVQVVRTSAVFANVNVSIENYNIVTSTPTLLTTIAYGNCAPTILMPTYSNAYAGLVGPAIPLVSKTTGAFVALERGTPGSATVANAAPQVLERPNTNNIVQIYPLLPPTVDP